MQLLDDTPNKYSNRVYQNLNNSENLGSLDKNKKNVGTGLVGSPACGDVIQFQIEVNDKNKITQAKTKVFGCPSAQASASLAIDKIKGTTLEDASKLKNTDIAQELTLPPIKLHCSHLAEEAIQAAIEDYKKKQC